MLNRVAHGVDRRIETRTLGEEGLETPYKVNELLWRTLGDSVYIPGDANAFNNLSMAILNFLWVCATLMGNRLPRARCGCRNISIYALSNTGFQGQLFQSIFHLPDFIEKGGTSQRGV